MISTIERAAAYLREMPSAIAGAGGHRATFEAACVLVRGFSLDEETAFQLLREVHNPTCQPKWSDRDLRHKIKSAAKESKREPGYLLDQRERDTAARLGTKDPAPSELDSASYSALADALIGRCPFVEDPDVYGYCERRHLMVAGAHAQLAGLPGVESQAALLAELCKTFEAETLARAGLVWRNRQTGKPDLSRFAHHDNRLVIPWRGLDGRVAILQRRRLDDSRDRKYVFPAGRKPLYPFGVEALRVTDAAWPLVFCEGALDVLALRLIALRDTTIPGGNGVRACDRLGLVPLGLPGLEGWRAEWASWAKGREARIAIDADRAGESAVRKIADDLYRAGATLVRRWRPPNGAKDWSESLLAGVR